MENNQRNSRKRLNSLILLVAFTAVMLIVSTYAWFSAQKNVTISNLEGKVNVAEGLMVSLDAKSWSQEVDFEDYDQNSAGTAGAANYKADLKELYEDKTNDLYIRNNIPTELVPVSTTGTEYAAWALAGDKESGTGSEEIKFYNGINVEGVQLYDIAQTDFAEADPTEVEFPGYYAIDIFLQNSSKIIQDTDGDGDVDGDDTPEVQGETKETLQLNVNSLLQLVTGGSELTGLQNTTRVALAMYEPNASADLTTSTGKTSSAYVTADQSQILNAYKNAEIADVAIWEPNADKHVETIVNTNNRIMLTPSGKVDTLYIAEAADVNNDNIAIFADGEFLPTFGLTANSLTAGQTVNVEGKSGISNIYNWATSDTNGVTGTNAGLKRQIALQTAKSTYDYTTVTKGVRNLISVSSTGEKIYEMGDATAAGANETGAVEFQMLKNTVVKCRLYLWLEGQDPDCINFASHGSGVHLDLGLVKGQEVGSAAGS